MNVPVTEFNDIKYLQRVVIHLYGILDDIDTADDVVKNNNVSYRKIVQTLQARKNDSGVNSPEGYRLFITKTDF